MSWFESPDPADEHFRRKDTAVVLIARAANALAFPQLRREFDVKRDFCAGPHDLTVPLPNVTIAQVE